MRNYKAVLDRYITCLFILPVVVIVFLSIIDISLWVLNKRSLNTIAYAGIKSGQSISVPNNLLNASLRCGMAFDKLKNKKSFFAYPEDVRQNFLESMEHNGVRDYQEISQFTNKSGCYLQYHHASDNYYFVLVIEGRLQNQEGISPFILRDLARRVKINIKKSPFVIYAIQRTAI